MLCMTYGRVVVVSVQCIYCFPLYSASSHFSRRFLPLRACKCTSICSILPKFANGGGRLKGAGGEEHCYCAVFFGIICWKAQTEHMRHTTSAMLPRIIRAGRAARCNKWWLQYTGATTTTTTTPTAMMMRDDEDTKKVSSMIPFPHVIRDTKRSA